MLCACGPACLLISKGVLAPCVSWLVSGTTRELCFIILMMLMNVKSAIAVMLC